MRKAILSTSLMAFACLAAASPLLAQSNTGTGTNPWSVSWTGPTSGSGTAVAVSSPPSPWANNAPNSYWISTNSSGSLPGGTGDNASRYAYTWTNVFSSATGGQVQATVWNDNFFNSFTINGVTTTFTPDPAPGNYAQSKAHIFTFNTQSGTNTLTFNTTGDGQTDGLNASFHTTTTPEPSSMALLGTGLVGLVPMVRRRRKA